MQPERVMRNTSRRHVDQRCVAGFDDPPFHLEGRRQFAVFDCQVARQHAGPANLFERCQVGGLAGAFGGDESAHVVARGEFRRRRPGRDFHPAAERRPVR